MSTETKKTEKKIVAKVDTKVDTKLDTKVEKKVEVKDHTAKVDVKNLRISTKFSVEIGKFIIKKNLQTAKKMLEEVILIKQAVPMKKYKKEVPHKVGMAAGRYPVKASEAVLMLLKSVESNAEEKGLATEKLIISEFITGKGTNQMHQGRHRGRSMKRTHIKIVVRESEK